MCLAQHHQILLYKDYLCLLPIVVVIRNSVFNGKTQLIKWGQTKLAYFFLLKNTYHITDKTPYKHFVRQM